MLPFSFFYPANQPVTSAVTTAHDVMTNALHSKLQLVFLCSWEVHELCVSCFYDSNDYVIVAGIWLRDHLPKGVSHLSHSIVTPVSVWVWPDESLEISLCKEVSQK